MSVYPGSEATAVVVFSPPPGAAAQSGTFPFGVRARSTEDANASAVVEGDITLGKVSGLQAKIVPVTSAGRWRGRHTIQLSNWGNAPVQLQLVASDPDAALGFYLRPDLVDLPIGGNATVRMTVRTRKPFMRGMQTRLPFQVIGEPAGAPPGPRGRIPVRRPQPPGRRRRAQPEADPVQDVRHARRRAADRGRRRRGVRLHPGPAAPPTSLEELGPPEKPKNFTVVATGPETLQASWTPIAQITGYQILDIDPASKVARGLIPVNGVAGPDRDRQADAGHRVLLPAAGPARHQDRPAVGPGVRPHREAGRQSVADPVGDADTTPTPSSAPPVDPTASPSPSNGDGYGSTVGRNGQPSPSDGTSPSGSATPDPLAGGAFALVAGTFPDDGGASPVPANLVTKLQAQFPTAKIISSVQYPKLELSPGRKRASPVTGCSWWSGRTPPRRRPRSTGAAWRSSPTTRC